MFQERYRREMDQISLEKAQMTNLVNAMTERRPGIRRRSLRRAAAVAVAVALLSGCVGAGIIHFRQARIHYTETVEEASAGVASAAIESDASGAAAGMASAVVKDYSFPVPSSIEEQMSSYDRILRHEKGGVNDLWSEMYEVEDEYWRISQWTADTLEGLQVLWPENAPKLSFSWLESHFTFVPGSSGLYFKKIRQTGEIWYSILTGAYQGDTGARFHLKLNWAPRSQWSDTWIVAPNWSQEIYTTRDGAEVSIAKATSVSGSPIYDVSCPMDFTNFSLSGTFPDQEDLYRLLDSLGLAGLRES